MKKTKNIFLLALSLGVILYTTFNFFLVKKIEQKFIGKETKNIFFKRGKIFDRNGVILAESENYFNFSFDPKFESEFLGLFVQGAKDFLNSNLQKTDDLTWKISLKEEFLNVNLKEEIDLDKFKYEVVEKRKYAYPFQMSMILGYTKRYENQSEVIVQGADNGSLVGVMNLEKKFDATLSEVNKKSDGNDVYITIDSLYQESLYKIVGKYSAQFNAEFTSGIIQDSHTGEIIAMSSYPSANSELLANSDQEYLEKISSIPNIYLNKITDVKASPGSVFKLFTSFFLLKNGFDEKKEILSEGCFNISQYQICEYNKNYYGVIDLTKALIKSSNIYFCQNLIDYYQNNLSSFNSIEDLSKQFGFGNGSYFGEISGLPGTGYELSEKNTEGLYFLGDICNSAIGQGNVNLTLLEVLNMINIIENNGSIYTPKIFLFATKDNFITSNRLNKFEKLEVFDGYDDVFSKIKEGMKGVAYDENSSLYRNFIDYKEFNIHAKTGTAEAYTYNNGVQEEVTHSWIAGFFEAGGKKYNYVFHMNGKGNGYTISFLLKDLLECIRNDFTLEICK